MEIGWIDFSKRDRDKVLEVISRLSVQGTMDELGIGAIRDSFADAFFPSVTTVQSRAKYLVLVPYILRAVLQTSIVQAHKGATVTYKDIRNSLDNLEKQCAKTMQQNSDSTASIMGKNKLYTDDWLVRPPSLIYWTGLRTLGIIKSGSLTNFLREFEEICKDERASKDELIASKEDVESDDADALNIDRTNFFPNGLPAFDDWDNLSIELTSVESDYLFNRITTMHPQSVFAYLLKHSYNPSNIEELYDMLKPTSINSDIKRRLFHAVEFNRLAVVAFTVYNNILADPASTLYAYTQQYLKEADLASISSIELTPIFTLNRISSGSLTDFLFAFKRAMQEGNIDKMKQAVIKRERQMKDDRASVNKAGTFTKWKGMEQLDYRRKHALTIISDIKRGLESV